MKARTMVYLEQQQLETLHTEPDHKRISLAELVRQRRSES